MECDILECIKTPSSQPNTRTNPQVAATIKILYQSRSFYKLTLDLNKTCSVTAALHKSVLQNSHFHNTSLFSSSYLQVNASLEEQAFTSAWGLKAKTTFLNAFNLLSDSDKKLMNKIKVLASANLPLDEREKVCFASQDCDSQIMVFICDSSLFN